MAFLKAGEVDRWISKPDPRHRIVLVYGPDTGLVTERADRLASKTGVDLNDPFSTIRLNADEVADDKARLVDEATTVGMFGGERLIRVSGTTRKNLVEAVKPVLDQPLRDCWIILESGDLKPRTGLRGAVEKSANAMALPCYQDNAQSLGQLVKEELSDQGYILENDTAEFLKSFLGGDRLASRNELRKLALYAGDETTITRDHILAIVGDASSIEVNDIIDAVAAGDMQAYENNLERFLLEGMAADMLIIQSLRHFQFLHELRGKMETHRISAASAVDSARPPVFFARKTRVSRSLSKLSVKAIETILTRLEKAAFEARSNPELAASIAGTSLLAALLIARTG